MLKKITIFCIFIKEVFLNFFLRRKKNKFNYSKASLIVFIFLFLNIILVIFGTLAILQGTNFTICANNATMSSCYILSPTPRLNWTYTKGTAPLVTDITTHARVRPGGDQRRFRINVIRAGTIVYDSSWRNGVWTRSFTIPANQLNFETSYSWRIDVEDEFGSRSGWTYGNNFTTPKICRPQNPSNLSHIVHNCNSYTIRWRDNAVNEDTYTVRVYNDLGGLEASRTISGTTFGTSGSTMSTTFTGQTDGYNLDYRIYATNDGGNSNIVNNTSKIILPLCNPSLNSISSFDCRNINASWTDNSDNESGYRVYVENVNIVGHHNQNSGNLAPNTESYSFNSAADGVDWRVRVQVYNPYVTSQYSAYQYITTSLCNPNLNAVDVTSSGCRNIEVDWTDNSVNEDGYHIFFIDTNTGTHSFTSNVAQNVGVGSMNYVNNSVTDGVAWEVYVMGYNNEGGSYTHTANSATQNIDTILCAPTNFDIWVSSDCSQLPGEDKWTIQPSWTDNSVNETQYRLQWHDNGGLPWNDVILGVNSEQHTAMYSPSDTYTFQVRAENDYFNSAWVPNPPESETVTACNADLEAIGDSDQDCDCVDVRWTVDGDTNDINHFNLYRSTNGNVYGDVTDESIIENISNIPNSGVNGYFFQDCDIVSGSVEYTYWVETCFDPYPACSEPERLESYIDGDGISTNPCPDLPIWKEWR